MKQIPKTDFQNAMRPFQTLAMFIYSNYFVLFSLFHINYLARRCKNDLKNVAIPCKSCNFITRVPISLQLVD